jgi:hypothetical protein
MSATRLILNFFQKKFFSKDMRRRNAGTHVLRAYNFCDDGATRCKQHAADRAL